MAAKANRRLPNGKSEDYVWIVPAPAGEALTLSNDNLLHRGETPEGLYFAAVP